MSLSEGMAFSPALGHYPRGVMVTAGVGPDGKAFFPRGQYGVAPNVPDAPTIGTATPGNAQASVAFTPPAWDGGSVITGYTATSTPGGLTGTSTGSPIVVPGLSNGTAYTFTVHATNAQGNSAESAASSACTPDAGYVIVALTVVGAGSNEVNGDYAECPDLFNDTKQYVHTTNMLIGICLVWDVPTQHYYWEIYSSATVMYTNVTPQSLPPMTGWYAVFGGAPVPTITYP
jgi:hypothetical protein